MQQGKSHISRARLLFLVLEFITDSLDSTKIDLAGNGDAMDVELSGNTPPDTTKGRFLPFHSLTF